MTNSTLSYEAPMTHVVEVCIERGFELSVAPGFTIDGDYDEEGVIW